MRSKKRTLWDRYKAIKKMTILSVFVTALLLGACGKEKTAEKKAEAPVSSAQQPPSAPAKNQETAGGPAIQEGEGELQQYKSEELPFAPEISFSYSIKQAGDALYYPQTTYDGEQGLSYNQIYRYNVLDDSTEVLPAVFLFKNPIRFQIGGDGSIYAVAYGYGDGGRGIDLEKYDAAGNNVYSTDPAAWVDSSKIGDDNYLIDLAADSAGRVFLACDDRVHLFDGQGNYEGSVDPLSAAPSADRICAIGMTGEDKTYLSVASADLNNRFLVRIDPVAKKAELAASGFPILHGNITADQEKDFLVSDGNTVYAYDLENLRRDALFSWSNCGYSANQISLLGVMSNGSILAIQRNLTAPNGDCVVKLTRLQPGEEAERIEIVLGVRHASMGATLQNTVADFNRTNTRYRVTIKGYMEGDWTDEALADAVRKLNLDIVSGNGPDLIDATFFLWDEEEKEALAKQGALEDLTPWLAGSAVLDTESFTGNMLETCMYKDSLVMLPSQFIMDCPVGRTADVGTRMGWTVEDVMALAQKHPGTPFFAHSGSVGLLNFCIQFSLDAYVDHAAGKCHFDTPEFIRLLEFAKNYGAEASDKDAIPYELIRSGDVLMLDGSIDKLKKIQIYMNALEGAPGFVGYPTVDGIPAVRLSVTGGGAILSQSAHKDGAWAFLEFYVRNIKTGGVFYDLPAVRERLEEQLKEEMTDEIKYSDRYSNGWTFTYHTMKQEEVDLLLKLVEAARTVPAGEGRIREIIWEEAAEFFEGPKSAAQVADVIQNRVQLYLNENR